MCSYVCVCVWLGDPVVADLGELDRPEETNNHAIRVGRARCCYMVVVHEQVYLHASRTVLR